MNASIIERGRVQSLRRLRPMFALIVIVVTITGFAGVCRCQDRGGLGKFQLSAWAAGGPSPYHTIHAGLEYGEALDIYTAGVDAGWLSRREIGSGIFRGRGEVIGELVPFWLARIPEQTVTIHQPDGYVSTTKIPSYNWHGISAAPLLRWNFGRSYRSFSPYGELGAGLLWTSQKFPQGGRQTTSRINFTPQVGFGTNVLTRAHQSINAGVSVVHISSAGLGDYNPGVNVNLQFRVGYAWWW